MRTIVLLLVLLSLSLAKEVVLIMGFPNPYKKMQLLQGSAQEEGLSLKGIYLRRQEELKALQLPQADLYLLDLPQEEMRKEVEKRLAGREYIVLSPPPTGKDAGLTARLFTYYNSGGSQNFKNMFRLLLGKPAEPPQVIPPVGFYTPSKGVLGELPEEAKTQRPVIILFHRQDIVSENTHILDQLMKAFEKKGLEAYGFFYPELEGLGKHKNLLLQEGKPFPSLLINLRLMYFNYEEEKRALEELGLVVMGGITYRGKLEEWQKSHSGLPVASIPFYYTLPEYLGIIDNTVVGYDDGEKRAIDHMLQNFVARVIAWKGLSEKPNADKRVAVIYYNYPPGEKNILASNLNVIRSAELLLKTAREKGYNVETPSEKELQNHLTHIIGLYYRKPVRKDLVDCLDFKSYRAWFDSLPEWVKKDVLSYWGEPERDNYLKGECFPIPIYRAGNFAFLPLAPRGADYLKSKDIYHSTKVPPSHYYLAFYIYVQKNFDVIVHFGTHGTQEWTPGKERALDLWDYPYMTLGDKPVVYPYIVDNIGEALNAKRRGRALIISHQTPAFAPSGTYGELEELHQLLHKEAQTEGKLKEILRKDIARKAFKAKLAQDIGYKTQGDILKDFETFSNKLHEHIHHVASQSVPLGLHTFGETKESELLHLTILQMLGKEWVSKWEREDYQEFLSQPLEKIKASKAFSIIGDCLEGKSQLKDCERIRELYRRFDASQELKSFFDALEGRYILTSYGGDPIKNPDSLPTGKNLYGFDPTRVPTRQAWQSAVEITDQWLKEYYAKHKSYPSKVAFSLWSTETMRHFGVAEAQILYLLGVRPKWDAGGRVVGLEVIP
ncbi:MAG: cobaltochelatase subunit CobN, partial [Aquificaceae bacterium]|nr:cobaltochelatase subunit CobN [Aquificaceae bacterium]